MCPCKGCEVRSENCHAGREDYKKFRTELDKKAEAKEKVKHIEIYMRAHRGLHYAGMRLPQYV